MTTYMQDFEGGSNGVGVTVGNSGGAGRTAVTTVFGTGSTATYTTTNPIKGTVSASVSAASAQLGALQITLPSGANTQAAAYAAYRWASAPSITISIGQLRSAAVRSISVALNANGTIKFSSNNADVYTTPTALSFPATFGIDIQTNSGTTTANGTMRYAVVDPASGAFLGGMTGYLESTGRHTGAGALVDQWRVGGPASEAVVRACVVDDMRVGDSYASVFVLSTLPPLPQPLPAIIDSTGWTAYNGTTILANLGDGDPNTGARSSSNPLRANLPAMVAPTTDLGVNLEGFRDGGSSSSVVAYLYEGATLRATSGTVTTLGAANTAATATFTLASLSAVTASAWPAGTLELRLSVSAS